MISQSKKKSVIEKIIKSSEFKSSQTYKKLLQYLLEYHLKDEVPNEYIIALEFFNRKSNHNSSKESTVRFYMYKLRKKLEQYYSKEGEEDDVVVSIPKGHYAMQFQKAEDNKQDQDLKTQPTIAKNTRINKVLLILSGLLSILVLIFIILWQQSTQVHKPISKSDPIWKSFFNNDYPVNILIGDFFVFEEGDDKYQKFRRIMDYNINTQYQYNEYKANNPDRTLREFPLKELPHNSIFNIKDIMHVFYSLDKTFNIKFTNTFDYKDLKSHNNIYIGEFKNLRILYDLINIIPIRTGHLVPKGRKITLFTDEWDTLGTLQSTIIFEEKENNKDIGLIAKLPGLNGERTMFITGFGYMSQIELVKMVSKRNAIEALENQIKNQYTPVIPDYFCAIFEVSGFQLTGYSTQLKLFKEIDENRYLESFRQLLSDVVPQNAD